jgi:hypothetical protein
MRKLRLTLVIGLVLPSIASAGAILTIRDGANDMITITASGFNEFSVNGNALADGASVSVPESDGAVNFSGLFSTNGQQDSRVLYKVYFTEPGEQISDLLQYTLVYNAGIRGSVSGSFQSDGETGLPGQLPSETSDTVAIFNERDGEYTRSHIDFGVNASSDSDIPEPTSVVLVGLGLVALGMARRLK